MSENLLPFLKAQGRQLTADLSNDTGEGEEYLLAFGAEGIVLLRLQQTGLLGGEWLGA